MLSQIQASCSRLSLNSTYASHRSGIRRLRPQISSSSTVQTRPFTSLYSHKLASKHSSRIATSRYYSINMDSKQEKEPVFIAAPIFYVNGSPHIGHLYTALLGDALARWHRILGHPTLYSIGTDEHGVKVQEAAEKAGKDVQQFCDEVTKTFADLWVEANISHDVYVRTTEERHKKAVAHIWRALEAKEKLYLGEFEGWYSVSDETFFTPLQVENELDELGKPTGRMIATETGNVVTWLKEPNYKFKLSDYEAPLLDWIAKDNHVYPPLRANELLQDITQRGLKDLSVSRLKEKIQWGIPVPGDENHVVYVWLDALTNYLTVCGYPEWDHATNAADHSLSKFWPSSYHIIGKDIVKFHAVYWPAFLLAAGLPAPKRVIAHGHWTKDRKKISKSKGNIVEPHDIISRLGLDPVRFVLLRQGGLAIDGDYNEEEAQNIISNELVNSLGNLISRVTGRGVNPTGAWPKPHHNALTPQEKELIERLQKLPQEVDELYKLCEFGKAIAAIFSVLNDVNLYLTVQAPWKSIIKPPKKPKNASSSSASSASASNNNEIPPTAPPSATELATQRPLQQQSTSSASNIVTSPQPPTDPEQRAKYDNNLYICLEAIRVCTLLLQPITPQLSDSTLNYLGIPQSSRNPFEHPYGVDYCQHSSLAQLTGDLFVLVDEREKKQARFEQKQKKTDTL